MIAGFPFIASSFDPDARAFVQTSGATDRAALNFFVKGIKRLGLWDDMVCWPLRSAQNAGTGSTAYSLGGLGTYNGTLVNGPTWGEDGIDMNAMDRRITTTAAANQPSTIFSVQVMTSENIIQVAYDGTDRQHLYRSPTTNDTIGFAGNVVFLDQYAAGSFFTMQLEFNGASGSSSYNGGSKVTRNFGANNLSNFRLGAPNNTQKGTLMAFAAVIDQGSAPLLHDIYSQTLGQGLELP
jgi:hypothetical protein